MELTLSPLRTAPVPGRFVLAVVRDVTDRRETQARLALAVDRLDAANRALRDFMLIAAHDLANPLCAIRSTGQMLSSAKERPTTEVRNFGRVITRQVDHLLALLGELNELTKLEAGQITAEPSDVSLPALAAESLEAAGLSPGDVAVDLTDVHLWADRGHSHRILTNYLTNARRYAGGCGISITAHRNGDAIDICVADTGPGVPPAFVPRLFDKFSRGPTANTDATGLGLAIVADLAQLNGGTAWYEPNAPTGAKFWVRLPAHP